MWSVTKASPPTIVLSQDASETCRFAADEAARYLGDILGTEPHVAANHAEGVRICLTQTDDERLGDEGYEFSVAGDTFRIAGRGPGGILYGVYEFLKRYGGCRFAGLGPDGQHVPRLGKIEIPETRTRHTPKLWYRGLQFSLLEPAEAMIQRLDWMASNGMNYVMVNFARGGAGDVEAFDPATGFKMTASERSQYTHEWYRRNLLPEIQKRGLKVDVNHHNLLYWLPGEIYFAEHPEWYALQNGRRSPRTAQLSICTSNAEAVEALVGNVLDYLRANPETSILGVIPEDGYGCCQCDECRELDVRGDDATRPPGRHTSRQGQNHAKIRRYALLINEVARAVRSEFPGVLVGMSAYADMTSPPSDVQLADNVVAWVAIYWRCGAHPLGPGECPVNAFFFDELSKWRSAHSGRLILYEYYMGMGTYRSLPFPVAEVICREWPRLKELGVDGATIQSTSLNQNLYGLNYQAFARTGWQDEVSYESLLDEHLQGMFGSVAGLIRPIYEGPRQALKRVEIEGPGISPFLPSRDIGCYRPSPWGINHLIQPGECELFGAYASCALRKASSDRERRQLRDLAAAIRYWRLAASVFALEARAEQAEREGNPDVAAALYEQVVDAVEAVIEYVESQPPRGWIDLAVASRFRRSSLQAARRRIEESSDRTRAS